MEKIIIAVTNMEEKDTSIYNFDNEEAALDFLVIEFLQTRINRLPDRCVMLEEKGVKYLVAVEKIDLPNRTIVPVHGGTLQAHFSGDDDYPGISIDFYPGEGTDGSITQFALVEQTDDFLRSCVWDKAWVEEPEIYNLEYDSVMMAQIAYSFYKKDDSKSYPPRLPFETFQKTAFKDKGYMKQILPENLYNLYTVCRTPGGELL